MKVNCVPFAGSLRLILPSCVFSALFVCLFVFGFVSRKTLYSVATISFLLFLRQKLYLFGWILKILFLLILLLLLLLFLVCFGLYVLLLSFLLLLLFLVCFGLYVLLLSFLLLLLLLLLLSHQLCRPQRHRSCTACPGILAPSLIQDSFRIVALPPTVHRRRRQIVGGLPS